MRIVFVGEEAAGARALRRILLSDHTLVGVLTSAGPDDRGTTVASIAAEHGVPATPAHRVRDAALADELRGLEVDVLLNVHSLHLVGADVLEAPRVGAFNLHPGPLPEYAGLNTASWALVHGRNRHGVTLHWMTPGIDTGDVVARSDFDLSATDTGVTVSSRAAEKGLELLDDLLVDLAVGPHAVARRPQELGDRRYYGTEVPRDGWIPWSAPSREVLDFVRAFDYRPFPSPWGRPRTTSAATGEIVVDRLRATDAPATRPAGEVHAAADGVHVATADGWVQVLGVRAGDRGRPPHEVLAHGTTLS